VCHCFNFARQDLRLDDPLPFLLVVHAAVGETVEVARVGCIVGVDGDTDGP